MKILLAFGALAALVQAWPAYADSDYCEEAVSSYNSAFADVEDRIRSYANCTSYSRGRDACSSEFSRLESAQYTFQSAVSNYRSECH